MGLQDKFSSENPYVLPVVIQTAASNQADLNVVMQESDYLQASAATSQPEGLTINPANPVPNVTIVAQQTYGASVGRRFFEDE